MPLSSASLSRFYQQLAQQLAAGLTLSQSLRASSSAPAADTHRLATLAENGASVATLVASAGPWLPQADRPFLVAAADAGRLPRVLVNLSERHAQIAQMHRRVLLACIYPVGVFHLGVLVFALFQRIDFETGLDWDLAAYLRDVFTILLPAWALVVVTWILARRDNPLVLALLDLLPAIGGYRRNQALADFSFALGNLLEGGAPIGRAWLTAGGIARSRRLDAAAKKIHARIELGEAPGTHLAGARVFPPEFIARYQTAETTGSLDTALLALSTEYQATADQRLMAATMLYPGLLFAAVAVMVGWLVITFALRYFAQINSVLDGI